MSNEIQQLLAAWDEHGAFKAIVPAPIYDAMEALRAALAAPQDAQPERAALEWCIENLPDGIAWGGPYDADHPQGEYHCSHCDARFKPEGDGTEHHNEGCGLVSARKVLAGGVAQESQACPDTRFEQHTKFVGEFLSEMYAIMVDPLADGATPVAEMCRILKETALQQREQLNAMQGESQAAPSAEPPKVRMCNRHDDCDKYDRLYKERHPDQAFVPYNQHCHDDECEDCFGS